VRVIQVPGFFSGDLHLGLGVIIVEFIVPQVDMVVQGDIFETMLDRHGEILPGIVHVSGFKQGDQLHRFGAHIGLGAVGDQAVVKPGLVGEFFGQLQHHEAAVTARVQVGIGVAPDHPFATQDVGPVVGVDFVGKAAVFGVAQNQLIGGEADVPVGVFGYQVFIDNCKIR